MDVRHFFKVPLLRFWHEIRWCFAVADASQNHVACAWQQDLANMGQKLKSLSFSRISQGGVGPT